MKKQRIKVNGKTIWRYEYESSEGWNWGKNYYIGTKDDWRKHVHELEELCKIRIKNIKKRHARLWEK